jgi:hypothetical protein
MYCPRCSHEQGSEEMRFCSRCGFSLAGVSVLLENPGIIPQPAKPIQVSKGRSCTIKESLLLTFLAWAIGLTLSLMWNIGGQFEFIAKVGSLVFFILGLVGLIRFLFAFLFMKDPIPLPLQANLNGASYSRTMADNPTRSALPPGQSIPISDYYSRSNTREIISQPSVTENTTRLLEDPER